MRPTGIIQCERQVFEMAHERLEAGGQKTLPRTHR
jgi:hypothetical protein